MGPRDERAGGWTLGPDEVVSACLNPLITGVDGALPASAECNLCAHDPFRIIVAASPPVASRKIAVCRHHFVQVCRDCDVRNDCMSAARLYVLATAGEHGAGSKRRTGSE